MSSSKGSKKEEIEQRFHASFISGAIAGMTAKTSIAPFDRVKAIFQVKLLYNSGL